MANLLALGALSLLEVQRITFLHRACEQSSQELLWQCKNTAVSDGLHTHGALLMCPLFF